MNNKGANTISAIIITAIITTLLCYIFFTLGVYKNSLENVNDSTTSNNDETTAKDLPLKIDTLKKIIDREFLYEYDAEKLADGMAEGMIASLDDPYASYYNKEQFKNFYMQTEGEYVGIGVYVAYDRVRGYPMVLAPLEGSPAAEAGILPGDYIWYVDDLKSADTDYNAIIDAIKGISGTKVKIGIVRLGENNSEEELDLEIERKKIELNPITSQVYEDNIGYIRMTSFDETSYDGFKKEYDKLLKEDKVKGLIIDLRDNPGGVLSVCAKITDLIVPAGKIVYTVDKAGKEEALYSDAAHITIPLVVLVNENSASASEVFTGAVKDYGVGIVIGTKTFGKGVVQTLKSLKDGTYIKLTTSEYFSPNGNKIDKEGITPDIEVTLPEKIKNTYNLKFEDDTQLQRAIEELKKKV